MVLYTNVCKLHITLHNIQECTALYYVFVSTKFYGGRRWKHCHATRRTWRKNRQPNMQECNKLLRTTNFPFASKITLQTIYYWEIDFVCWARVRPQRTANSFEYSNWDLVVTVARSTFFVQAFLFYFASSPSCIYSGLSFAQVFGSFVLSCAGIFCRCTN